MTESSSQSAKPRRPRTTEAQVRRMVRRLIRAPFLAVAMILEEPVVWLILGGLLLTKYGAPSLLTWTVTP